MALDSGFTRLENSFVVKVVQLNTLRSVSMLTGKAQPISVGYGKIHSQAPSLLCEIVLHSCHHAVLLVTFMLALQDLGNTKALRDRETTPGSSNQALAPMLQGPHVEQVTFYFWQRFWSLIPMALDPQRKIPIKGKIWQESAEVSMHFPVQLLYFKPYPKSNGSMGILPVTSAGILYGFSYWPVCYECASSSNATTKGCGSKEELSKHGSLINIVQMATN